MDSALTVRTGPLEFRGFGDEGFIIQPRGLEGWSDGTTMRTVTTPMPQSHGDFDQPGYLSGRLVNLRGTCIADSQWELERYRDQFIGWGAAGTKFTVVVEQGGRALRGQARIAANQRPSFIDLGDGLNASFSTSWWFPDPRKYGEAYSFGPGSTVTTEMRGNFPSLPRLRVTGSASGGYTITGPGGAQIVITRPLVSGTPHEFITADATLLVGGTRVLGGVSKAELFTIPPGRSQVSVSGGLSLTVRGDEPFI
jgi:hypothetical protein